jgi:solute carrier family 45 protein 1/2/4
VDLTGVFGWLGEKQLKILAVISSLLLIGTHGMTASLVKERVLVSTRYNVFVNLNPGSLLI